MADELVRRPGLAARRVDGVEELDLAFAVRRQSLPADTGLQVDDAAFVSALDEGSARPATRSPCGAAAVAGQSSGRAGKDVVERRAELAGHGVERPDEG